MDPNLFASRVADLEAEAFRQEKEVLATYGMLMQSSEGADPCKHCSPLLCTCCLGVWGLPADDIGVLFIHVTSAQGPTRRTRRDVYMEHDFEELDCSPGNAVPIMAQKSLVGHSKGGAAAWQMAGLLQSVESGVVPGNHDADNVDALFQQRSLLMFSSKII